MKDLGYDPLKDLTPIVLALAVPNVLVVNPGVPAQTLPELLDLARSKPGPELRVGRHGLEHAPAGRDAEARGRIDIVNVTYKGAGPALQDLLAARCR